MQHVERGSTIFKHNGKKKQFANKKRTVCLRDRWKPICSYERDVRRFRLANNRRISSLCQLLPTYLSYINVRIHFKKCGKCRTTKKEQEEEEIFWPAKQGERKIVVWSLKTSCLEKEQKEKLEKEQEEKLEKEQKEVKERVEKERQKSLNSQGFMDGSVLLELSVLQDKTVEWEIQRYCVSNCMGLTHLLKNTNVDSSI